MQGGSSGGRPVACSAETHADVRLRFYNKKMNDLMVRTRINAIGKMCTGIAAR